MQATMTVCWTACSNRLDRIPGGLFPGADRDAAYDRFLQPQVKTWSGSWLKATLQDITRSLRDFRDAKFPNNEPRRNPRRGLCGIAPGFNPGLQNWIRSGS